MTTLVSVAVITYNQEKHIAQTLDSILMQKCNFDFNIIVGEDYSTDNTRMICEKYEKNYPGKVIILKHRQNLGLIRNYAATFANCTGKYIAQCDGDDYWTDPDKLQKQADFLENNPQYSLCFHDIEQIFEGENTEKSYLETFRAGDYVPDNIWEEWVIATSTVMFYRKMVESPYYLKYATHKHMLQQDVFIIATANEQGKIFGLEEKMSVYRKHEGSVTADGSSPKTDRMQRMLNYIRLIGKVYNGKYRKISKQYFSFKAYRYAYVCRERKLYFKFLSFFVQAFFSCPSKFYQLLKQELNTKFKKKA